MTWTKPKYPGDHVRIILLRRGDELGDVRIQMYGKPDDEAPARVGAFLPGTVMCSPGDTPKTEPEEHQWCAVDAANYYFDFYLAQALAEGWEEYRP